MNYSRYCCKIEEKCANHTLLLSTVVSLLILLLSLVASVWLLIVVSKLSILSGLILLEKLLMVFSARRSFVIFIALNKDGPVKANFRELQLI